MGDERMDDEAGSAVALNSPSCCGDVEAAEGAVTLDRSSMMMMMMMMKRKFV